jgi:predicted PurR-regulated permease PerM
MIVVPQKMKSFLKSKLPLSAIMMAVLTTIAFSVYCDDTAFKSFARSFVKQKISSSGPTSKIKADISAYFLGNTLTILNHNVVYRWKSGTLINNPTLTFTASMPPYRGPPTAITL